MCLNLHFSTFQPLCTYPTNNTIGPKTTTKPSVFAMVWEGIQTSGFRDILGRLAGWCPKEPLSQHFRICEAEYVLIDISVHLKLCVPHPTKHKTCANRLRNRPFWQRFGKPSKLRISTHSGTSGWLESENAFKPTFSSLGG